jgi:Mg-chelatase subunit ChlD
VNLIRLLLKLVLAFLFSACTASSIGKDAAALAEADEPAPPCPESASAVAPVARPGAARESAALAASPARVAKPAPAPLAPPRLSAGAIAGVAAERARIGTGSGASISSVVAPSQIATAPVTAGLVDDNEKWSDYLAYRRRAGGFNVRERDVEGRIIVEVRDAQGRAVHDARIEVGGTQLRTDSAGRALFHPHAQGPTQLTHWTVTARKGGFSSSTVADLGQPHNARLTLGTERDKAVRLDLLFLIDTTGSMADEIDRLRSTMDVIVKDIARNGVPDIRYGLVHYRDRGDEYVVRSHAFTPSLRAFRRDLACLRAAGGGDEPESLNLALNTAVHKMAWRGEDSVRMVILVADAPPHLDYQDEPFDYAQDMAHAAAKGIKIFPIGASGLNAQGEYIFRQMAQFTGGKFVFLTYADRNRPGAAPGVETSHDVRDYSVDHLDRVVVRLVSEELRPLRD